MHPETDAIVDIPPQRVKYFGGPGKMLLPGTASLAAMLARVPQAQLTTTQQLRQALTQRFGVQGTCPVTTQKALQSLANQPGQTVAYWRVVGGSGGLVARFPGGAQSHAALLKQEGFEIDTSGGTPRVKHFKQRLVSGEIFNHHPGS